MLIRQGDVFIQRVDRMPPQAKQSPIPHGTLVHGEVTGHSHRLEDMKTGKLYSGGAGGDLFLEITAPPGRIVHEEHGPIDLDKGVYRVWRQREYTPQAIRPVYD